MFQDKTKVSDNDQKKFEIIALVSLNILSLIVIIVLNLVIWCYSDREDQEQTFRKYSVAVNRKSKRETPLKDQVSHKQSPTHLSQGSQIDQQVKQSGHKAGQQHQTDHNAASNISTTDIKANKGIGSSTSAGSRGSQKKHP